MHIDDERACKCSKHMQLPVSQCSACCRRLSQSKASSTASSPFKCLEAVLCLQGAVTVAVRYGAMRRQFGPAGGPEIAVLDYRSQQEKLMPLLASAYGIHFATRYLVAQYAEAKRTKEEDVIADVHALSAGMPFLSNRQSELASTCMRNTDCRPLKVGRLGRNVWQKEK